LRAKRTITGSTLYDAIQCLKRVDLDAFGEPARRDAVNPFLQMLWERGTAYEREVIAKLGRQERLVDLSSLPADEKERETAKAMLERAPLIYSGGIQADGLLGEPDILRLERQNYYVLGDIKSGAGEAPSGKLKKQYAVQVGLYVDVLERTGRSAGRYGFIWTSMARRSRTTFRTRVGKTPPRRGGTCTKKRATSHLTSSEAEA
jgi:hypothetical protein